MGCPAMQMIEEDIHAALLALPGIGAVEIETVWLPVWTKSRLSAEGRDALMLQGVAL
jgi:metal-sulfur cluster biosynthetic enzyme